MQCIRTLAYEVANPQMTLRVFYSSHKKVDKSKYKIFMQLSFD